MSLSPKELILCEARCKKKMLISENIRKIVGNFERLREKIGRNINDAFISELIEILNENDNQRLLKFMETNEDVAMEYIRNKDLDNLI